MYISYHSGKPKTIIKGFCFICVDYDETIDNNEFTALITLAQITKQSTLIIILLKDYNEGHKKLIEIALNTYFGN